MIHKYCPYCNWEIVDGECSNLTSPCGYKGPGRTREDAPAGKLGDTTGDPQNNGDYGTTFYGEET